MTLVKDGLGQMAQFGTPLPSPYLLLLELLGLVDYRPHILEDEGEGRGVATRGKRGGTRAEDAVFENCHACGSLPRDIFEVIQGSVQAALGRKIKGV